MPPVRHGAATIHRIERAAGSLAARSVARMDETLPWFTAMPAEQRSWVGLVAQAGIAALVQWLRRPGIGPDISDQVFAAAPRELARSVTLQQTVALIQVTVEVVESQIEALAAPGEEALLRDAVLRYSRELAFASARVYATAAEERGAWDARLEALVVDALLRGDSDDGPDTLASRAAALGWGSPASVSVLVGSPPAEPPQVVLDSVQRTARRAGLDVLAGVHGARLVAVLGTDRAPLAAAQALLGEFGPGPVVLGPSGPDLPSAAVSARAALAGIHAVAAWPTAPRPVLAQDLLAERALDGDTAARGALVENVYIPLLEAGATVLGTVSTYVEQGGSLEATARALFVHPNTVRYRLRKAAEVSGLSPGAPRDAFALRIALALGRLSEIERGL